jgi:hypothetical protein
VGPAAGFYTTGQLLLDEQRMIETLVLHGACRKRFD